MELTVIPEIVFAALSPSSHSINDKQGQFKEDLACLILSSFSFENCIFGSKDTRQVFK